MITIGHFSPDTGNIGFAGVTRVVLSGGSARMENGQLVVSGNQSVLLLTRIEWYHGYSRAQVETLARAVDRIPADYAALVARQRKVQSEIMDRASMNFGGSIRPRCWSRSSIWAATGFWPKARETTRRCSPGPA
ncbi:MAG: hypothetical protein ABSH56_23790 [Bryobacteraceae bacterium]